MGSVPACRDEIMAGKLPARRLLCSEVVVAGR